MELRDPGGISCPDRDGGNQMVRFSKNLIKQPIIATASK
jgi:hypothetical protein